MAHVKIYTILLFILFANINCKINKQALTESMGQEVIEMGSPSKELPSDLEEEPSSENDDGKSTSTTLGAATKNLKIKSNFSRSIKNEMKNDEARIEKELADLYKDTDYKLDSAEVAKALKTIQKPVITSDPEGPDTPIGRSNKKIQFEPDDLSPEGIAKFQTRADIIHCPKQKLIEEEDETTTGTDAVDIPVSKANYVLTSVVLFLLSIIINL